MILSVALCSYNGELFLEQQLNSILDQTVQVHEIVVCDDGSTDKTVELLKKYEKKFPNLIHLFTNDITSGTIKNFEKVISLTKGDLIFLADQDDIWHQNKVEIMVNFFKENTRCKLLFTNGDLIDENGHSLLATLWEKWHFSTDMQDKWKDNKNAFKDLIINKNKITGATVCFHKSLKDLVLPIAAPYGYWHDAWLGIHASANEGLMFLNRSLINYRIHKNQQIGITNDLEKNIIENSNSNPVNIDRFYKKIRKKYPELKSLVPLSKRRKLLKRIIVKLRKTFSNMINRKYFYKCN